MPTIQELNELVKNFNKTTTEILARKKIPSDFKPEIVSKKIDEDLQTHKENYLAKAQKFFENADQNFKSNYQQLQSLRFPARFASDNLGGSMTEDIFKKKSLGELQTQRALSFLNTFGKNYQLILTEMNTAKMLGEIDYFSSLIHYSLASVPDASSQVSLPTEAVKFYKDVQKIADEYDLQKGITEYKTRLQEMANVSSESGSFVKTLEAGNILYYSQNLTRAMKESAMMEDLPDGKKIIDAVNASMPYWNSVNSPKVDSYNKIVV